MSPESLRCASTEIGSATNVQLVLPAAKQQATEKAWGIRLCSHTICRSWLWCQSYNMETQHRLCLHVAYGRYGEYCRLLNSQQPKKCELQVEQIVAGNLAAGPWSYFLLFSRSHMLQEWHLRGSSTSMKHIEIRFWSFLLAQNCWQLPRKRH